MQSTVVVPVYQAPAVLRVFLESLVASLEPDTQLVVVNDGSGGAAQLLLEECLLPLKEKSAGITVDIIWHEWPKGCAASINEALRRATGDYVYLVDSDLILTQGWQAGLRATLDSDASVGMAGAVLLYPQTGGIQHCGVTFTESLGRHLMLNALPSTLPSEPFPVQLVVFALFAMTRQVLEDTGPLDEDFFNGYEDFDFQMRARTRGHQTLMDPGTVVYHWERSNGIHRASNRKSNLGRFWKRWGTSLDADMWDRLFVRIEEAAGESIYTDPIVGVDLAEARSDAREFWRHLSGRASGLERIHDGSHDVADSTIPLPLTLPGHVVQEPARLLLLTDNFVRLLNNWLWFAQRSAVRNDDLIVDLHGNCLTVEDIRTSCWPGQRVR